MKKKKRPPLAFDESFTVQTIGEVTEKIVELEMKGYRSCEIFTKLIFDKFGDYHREVYVKKV